MPGKSYLSRHRERVCHRQRPRQSFHVQRHGDHVHHLCHNGSNDICDSAKGEPEHNGLSPFGREVVKEMNRLGIIIDISHTSAKTVQDVLELSTAPIIASTHPPGLYAITRGILRMIRSKQSQPKEE